MRTPLRMLFVTDRQLLPAIHGNRVRVLEFLRALVSGGFDFEILTLRMFEASMPLNCARFISFADGVQFAPGENALTHAPLEVGKAVAQRCRETSFDAVIIHHQFMHNVINYVPKSCKRILLADDVFSLRQSFDSNWVQCSEEAESDIVGKFDAILAFPPDLKAFQAMAPRKSVLALPFSVPPEKLLRLPEVISNSLLFVGYDHPGNLGIITFIQSCFPQMRRQVPNIRLRVVGTICDQITTNRDGIVLERYSSNIEEAYAQSRIVILPIEHGTGMSVKLLEAMAYGRPVVSTSIGVRGIMDNLRNHVRIVDTVADITEPVIHLLANPKEARSMADAAFAFVTKHFTRESALGEFHDWIYSFQARK